ncbi:hypothetical protein BHE74_00009209 [Ensete ventricosum]|nr:hypothetical protein BHE74_00009209 [Ensete ventricosum]RZR86026.1 hypothetical protein BHM03_00013116 [Ensete ventricosum]
MFKQDIDRYKVGNPRTFHYLNQSNCYEIDGLDESEEYLATRRAMDVVGISSDEQDAIFRVVAAILHLGNVEFAEGEEVDSSVPKDEKSCFHLRTAAELFMLVNRINCSIGQDPDSKFLIGVLDIYGFESFKTNRCFTGTLLYSSRKMSKYLHDLHQIWSRLTVKEGIMAQVGLLLPLLALVVVLVFFLTIAEGGSGGGAGDELALGWIPIRSDCRESIIECLTGDEFELGTDATRCILARSAITPFRLSRWKRGDGFFFF